MNSFMVGFVDCLSYIVGTTLSLDDLLIVCAIYPWLHPCLLFPEKYAGEGCGWKIWRETYDCDSWTTFVERHVAYRCQRIFVF